MFFLLLADISSTPYRFWWMFSVRGYSSIDEKLTFTLKSVSAQGTLVRNGMRPLFRIGHFGPWERIPTSVTLSSTESTCNLTFSFSASTLISTLNKRLRWFDSLQFFPTTLTDHITSSSQYQPFLGPNFQHILRSKLKESDHKAGDNVLLAVFPWLESIPREHQGKIIEEALHQWVLRTTTR